jgi:glycerol dehydrogenase
MTRSFVSPSQYVQAVGVLDQLGSRVHRLGESALLVTDEIVHGIIGDSVEQSLSTAGVEYRTAIFDGECTEDEIDRLAEIARDERADVIIGAGGGKSIDVAKGVRGQVGGSVSSGPAVASTDAATGRLSVV